MTGQSSVSVVGFLDEGLLVYSFNRFVAHGLVSVVGFLDEGLLDLRINPLEDKNKGFSGWIFR
ncbi:TPA: hypothetical protein I8Z56_003129 [Legionella pneumophila]|nr:hypothetical protein [Legionella pneumophila]HAT1906074.1 hypothetical protein [Legionella pneumophila]HAT3984181.1 hypothetical protein [Legionella pneumophila]